MCSFFCFQKNEPPMGYIVQLLYKDDFSPSQQSTSRSYGRVLQAKTVALHFVCEVQRLYKDDFSPSQQSTSRSYDRVLQAKTVALHFVCEVQLLYKDDFSPSQQRERCSFFSPEKNEPKSRAKGQGIAIPLSLCTPLTPKRLL